MLPVFPGTGQTDLGKLAATCADPGGQWLNFLLFYSKVIPKPRVFSGGARDLARSLFKLSERTAAGRIAKQGMIGDNLAK